LHQARTLVTSDDAIARGGRVSVPTEAVPSASQTTSFTLLVDADPARRNRRAIDAILLAALAVTTALIALVASSAP
jgi:hypothetical protein